MTSIPYIPAIDRPETYLTAGYKVRTWLLTRDHKRIAILYMIFITFFFVIGGVAATLMRLELVTPRADLFQPDAYNRLFTMHGIIMVFFFLIPSIPAVLGNFLIPIMIGARDMAFPRINLFSWYLFIIGGAITFFALLLGGVDTGWTFYTPFSSVYSDSWVTLAIVGIFINGFSSILTGLNIIVTVHTMRAPGMYWFRMPLFVWSIYATALIQVLATPVIAITLLLVAVERVTGIGIFNPALGGDPVLFQHMFWFYSHPAVYIMILPSFGVMSEIITCFSHKRIFGYRFVAFSSFAIAVLGFLTWAHHMFVAGISLYAGITFSFVSFIVAIPSAIKAFNWTFTLYKGSVDLKTPMLYALGFLGLFVMGGLTGFFVATLGLDVHVHDTYFVVAHFHYIMVGGAVMGYLGGIHFWWPKITGKMYPEWWGRFSAFTIFMGFNLTFFPQFILGYLGMPRRYASYPDEFQVLNVLSSAGASILAVGYVLPLTYLLWSLKWGKPATQNPFGAAGLEWTTSSPPPPENFKVQPIVTDEAYAYEKIPLPPPSP